MKARGVTGSTLLELIAVVVIVAVLLVLALPAHQRHLQNMRRALASAVLLEAMLRQEQYFLDHKRYAQRLTELDYPAHPYYIDREGQVVPPLSDERTYLIELATGADSYTLSATPQLGQAADRSCGTLSLDGLGVRRASGERGARECW